jgi:release factor glutamine methyltransferase
VSADAVLANLPYVSEGAELAPEIERFEPAGALFAGPDGLDVIRRLVRELDGVPFVALEVGFDQADAVAALLVEAGYSRVDRRRDLAGHERVIVGRR